MVDLVVGRRDVRVDVRGILVDRYMVVPSVMSSTSPAKFLLEVLQTDSLGVVYPTLVNRRGEISEDDRLVTRSYGRAEVDLLVLEYVAGVVGDSLPSLTARR